MTVIDSTGRLFGRFNLIDAAAAILASAVLSLGLLAYTVVRDQPPVISAVAPPTLTVSGQTRLRLTGRHFRPFLKAFVVKRDEDDPAHGTRPVEFLIGTPTAVELGLPELQAGTYDIHLYDGLLEVARRESAFTIRVPPSPGGPEGS